MISFSAHFQGSLFEKNTCLTKTTCKILQVHSIGKKLGHLPPVYLFRYCPHKRFLVEKHRKKSKTCQTLCCTRVFGCFVRLWSCSLSRSSFSNVSSFLRASFNCKDFLDFTGVFMTWSWWLITSSAFVTSSNFSFSLIRSSFKSLRKLRSESMLLMGSMSTAIFCGALKVFSTPLPGWFWEKGDNSRKGCADRAWRLKLTPDGNPSEFL